jgi:hypothetical protein
MHALELARGRNRIFNWRALNEWRCTGRERAKSDFFVREALVEGLETLFLIRFLNEAEEGKWIRA